MSVTPIMSAPTARTKCANRDEDAREAEGPMSTNELVQYIRENEPDPTRREMYFGIMRNVLEATRP